MAQLIITAADDELDAVLEILSEAELDGDLVNFQIERVED